METTMFLSFIAQGRRNGFSIGEAKEIKKGTFLKYFQKNSFPIAHPLLGKINMRINETTLWNAIIHLQN